MDDDDLLRCLVLAFPEMGSDARDAFALARVRVRAGYPFTQTQRRHLLRLLALVATLRTPRSTP
jgi:hypothetical protein